MSVQLTTIAPGSQSQAGQIDERLKNLHKLMETTPARVRDEFERRMVLSWIHHDSSLEGTVYSPDELISAVRGDAPPDPSLVPVYDEIRQNKAAITLCYELAKKKLKVDADTVKDLYVCLAPDEVDGKKPPAYRKDMPLHRLYLHEIASPEKIAPKLKQFSDWVNAPDTRKTTHTVRLAAKAHYYLLQIYPYPKHSGKVARLVMNLILLNGGYTPAIVHATERQRYYDALKTNENAVSQIVRESLIASIDSGIRYFEQFAPPPAPPDPKKRKRVEIGRSAKAAQIARNGGKNGLSLSAGRKSTAPWSDAPRAGKSAAPAKASSKASVAPPAKTLVPARAAKPLVKPTVRVASAPAKSSAPAKPKSSSLKAVKTAAAKKSAKPASRR